ncbi:condensation domain-containing protein, partial [Streptomyces sp. TRM76130]|nr:condensation domain-containing protein [Streptomyces sp. TRM76130]
DPAAVRGYAATRLPAHLVPAVVTVLDRLPLTVNGKVDKAALPAPEAAAGTGRAPATPVEEILCGLFADVLGREQVGPDDSFFASGGDSLLGMRLTARIRAVLDADLSVRDLFATPSAAGLARTLAGTGAGSRAPLRPAVRPDRVPLSYAQRRMWFLNRMATGASADTTGAYNLPLALRLTGDLDRRALEAALGDLADRHESLRTVFPDTDGEPWQRVLSGPAARPPLTVIETDPTGLPDALAG